MASKTFEELALELNPLYQRIIDMKAKEEAEKAEEAKNAEKELSLKYLNYKLVPKTDTEEEKIILTFEVTAKNLGNNNCIGKIHINKAGSNDEGFAREIGIADNNTKKVEFSDESVGFFMKWCENFVASVSCSSAKIMSEEITFELNTPDVGNTEFWHEGKVIGRDGKGDVKSIRVLCNVSLPKKINETIKFITENSGNTDVFDKNRIAYNNSVEIEASQENRQEMMRIVSQDDGKNNRSDMEKYPNNFKEFGGYIKDGKVIPLKAGEVTDPCVQSHAEIKDLPTDKYSTFHSHPSGFCSETTDYGAGNRITNSGKFQQPPSGENEEEKGDLDNLLCNKNHYVFARGNGYVYIYNSEGIQAKFKSEYFVKPKTTK